MALSLHFSFSKPALEAAVLAGQYPNIRTFQYGGMSVNSETFHADAPKFATSDGAAPWYNLTYGASISSPSKGGHTQLNPFEQFSATCTYFAVGLVDLGKTTPIGLIQSSVGGKCRDVAAVWVAFFSRCGRFAAVSSADRDADRSIPRQRDPHHLQERVRLQVECIGAGPERWVPDHVEALVRNGDALCEHLRRRLGLV